MGKVMRVQKVPRVGSPGSRSPTALSKNERVLWKEIDGIVSCPNKEIAAHLYVEHVMVSAFRFLCVGIGQKIKIILLFNLYLLLFMTSLYFFTIYESYCIILTHFFTFIYSTFSNKFSVQ